MIIEEVNEEIIIFYLSQEILVLYNPNVKINITLD